MIGRAQSYTKRMKRIFWILVFALLCVWPLKGRWLDMQKATQPLPIATPASTPRPELVLLSGGGREAFVEGALSAGSESYSAQVRPFSPEGRVALPAGKGALILCLEEGVRFAAPPSRGLPLLVYCTEGQQGPDWPEESYALRYDPQGAAETALSQALSYPPHDYPVRLTALFESREGEAYRLFSEAAEAGKVFKKQVYVKEDEKQKLEHFLVDAVSRALPGTVDGIFAETAELAVAAAQAVSEADIYGLEVFSAAVSDELLALMEAQPGVMAAAVGQDDAFAGSYLRFQAERLLAGLPVPREATLLPALFVPPSAGPQ